MGFCAKESVYYIKQQCFYTDEEGKLALAAQNKMLNNICRNYSSVAFIMGFSMFNGYNAKKINLNEGQVGRPKITFVPYFPNVKYITKPHLHIYIVGEYAVTVSKEFVHRRNIIFYKRNPQTTVKCSPFREQRRRDGQFFYEYIERQSINIRFGGDKEILKRYMQDEYYLPHKCFVSEKCS